MQPVTFPEEILKWRKEIQSIYVDESLYGYIVSLVQATRSHALVRLPASPRAGISILSLASSFAWMDGRKDLKPDDIQKAFLPVMAHRIFCADAESGTAEHILNEIQKRTPLPR